jgi:tetratricopeptide (TPR) repeat protein
MLAKISYLKLCLLIQSCNQRRDVVQTRYLHKRDILTTFLWLGTRLGITSAIFLQTLFSQFNIAPAWSQPSIAPSPIAPESLVVEQLPIEVQLSQARELRERNEFDAAIALYLKILQQNPQQRQAREELALTYAYKQEHQKSIQLYKGLIAEEPQNIDLKLQLARVTKWKGDHQEAIALYETILAQDPNNITAKLGRAEVLSWAGRHDESLKAYAAILQQDPGNLQAQLGQAQVLSWAGRHDDSLKAYAAILQRDPGNLQAQLGRAQVTAWANRHAQSLELYNEILQQHPDSVEALQGRAQVTLWSGESEAAISLYRQALEKFPRSPELRLGLARVYQSEQKVSEAVKVLQPLIDSRNTEALGLLRDIQAVRATTEFRSDRNNFGQASHSIQQTVRFRINNSDTVQHVKTGFTSFEQRNFEPLNNIPIQVGIEGKVDQVTLRGAVGVDLFDRLSAVPRLSTEIGGEILSNVTLSGVAEYGAYKSNVQTLENEITALQVGPNLYWQIDRNTGLFSLYRWGSYNDGNHEQQFLVKLERQLGQFFVAGSVFNWSYETDPQNGYFAPPDFLVYTGEVGWEGNLFNPLRCRVSAALGRQRLFGEFTNANTYQTRCTAKLSPNFEADLGYIYTNVRDQNTGGSGYNNRTITGQLRLLF